MLSRQGRRLNEEKVARIQWLLAHTDMTISEITERHGCSKAAILRINEKFGIRNYTGRSYWYVNKDWRVVISERRSEIDRGASLTEKAS